MNGRTGLFVMSLILVLALALAFGPNAVAIEEENEPDPNACMGPTDPFCPVGPGSGGWPPEYVPQCYICDLDFTDPLNMAGTAFYDCYLVDPLVQNGYTNCSPGDSVNYCRFSGSFCQIT